MSYNHDRSLDQRRKRYKELMSKQVTPSEAKYVVICTRDAADGHYGDGFNYDKFHYFANRATAIAWAQHYSDICDHVAGVFKRPEFIARVDVR